MVSEEFKRAYKSAEQAVLAAVPNDAIHFLLSGWGNAREIIPVYLTDDMAPDQKLAGGCEHCTYLGMWSDSWAGYPPSRHGLIWLSEKGIRAMRAAISPPTRDLTYLDSYLATIKREQGPLVGNTAAVLVHELGHALQWDHVLDAMEEMRAAGYLPGAGPRPARGCGGCPTRSL